MFQFGLTVFIWLESLGWNILELIDHYLEKKLFCVGIESMSNQCKLLRNYTENEPPSSPRNWSLIKCVLDTKSNDILVSNS